MVVKVALEEREVSTPCQDPQPRAPGQEEEPAEHLTVEISGDFVHWKGRESAGILGDLLKGQSTGALSRALTQSSGTGKETQGILKQ